MKKLLLLLVLPALLPACGRGRLRPDTIERRSEQVLELAGSGHADQAWREYSELARESRRQHPDLLVQVATGILSEALAAEQPAMRLDAVNALRYADTRFAFKSAIEKLDDDDIELKVAAVELLRLLGRTGTVRILQPVLNELAAPAAFVATPESRAAELLLMHVAWTMAALGEKGMPVAPAVNSMSSPDPRIRVAAARALEEFLNSDALPSLTYGMESDVDWSVQFASAQALLKFRRTQLVDSFATVAAESGIPQRVTWAVEMRKKHGLGPAPEWLVGVASYNSSDAVRSAVALALGQMHFEEAKPRLEEMLLNLEPEVQVSAAYALVLMGDTGKLSVLKQLARGPKPEGRELSITYLAALDPKKHYRMFQAALNDPDPRVRLAALMPLKEFSLDRTIYDLAPRLGDDDPNVKLAAAAIVRLMKPIED